MTINTKPAKRVLIVDDQQRVLDVLPEILASFRHRDVYEITTTQSVADTLAILQHEHFDLILLDVVIPGIGDPLLRRQGLDLMKRIRDCGVTAPVLMMSGDWDSRREADALIEGAIGFLHKPFDVRELDRLVAHAIAATTSDRAPLPPRRESPFIQMPTNVQPRWPRSSNSTSPRSIRSRRVMT